MPEMQIFYRNVYGAPRIYPADQAARRFAELLNVRTFNDSQIKQIQALGFDIELVQDPTSLRLYTGSTSPVGGAG